jgi:hypothetical protein
MAVVENKATELGDVLIIRAEVPIVGLISLTDFIDTTTGEDGNKFFNKEFRYTIDGVNYTGWQDLTTVNLQGVDVRPEDTFIIEYRYTRVGTDTTGEIAYVNSNLSGEYDERGCGTTYNNSIFGEMFSCTDTEVLGWCINVTEKLYQKGIVPNFVERGSLANQSREDEDYINFWRSVACFFAYHVIFARKLINFETNLDSLKDFLSQRGIFFCDNQSIGQINEILNNQFRERARRGTKKIFSKEGEYKGELLRYLCYNEEIDEFLFNLTDNNLTGCWIDKNSSEYSGSLFQSGLIKAYEPIEGFVSKLNYPLINESSISISNNEFVISPNSVLTGIQDNSKTLPIIINPSLGYEIVAYVKVSSGSNITFSMGSKVSDKDGNFQSLEDSTSGNNLENFFTNESLLIEDKFYLIRGIIYPYNQPNLNIDEARLDVGFGKHLRFKVENRRIYPFITFNGTGTVTLADFKIKPVSLPYSTGGYVQAQNFISMFATNRNGEKSELESFQDIRKYLIPYNSTLQPIWLDKVEELE